MMNNLILFISYFTLWLLFFSSWQLSKYDIKGSDNAVLTRVIFTLAIFLLLRIVASYFPDLTDASGFTLQVIFTWFFSISLYAAYPMRVMLRGRVAKWENIYVLYPFIILLAIFYIISSLGCSFASFDLSEVYRNGEIFSLSISLRLFVGVLIFCSIFVPYGMYWRLKLNDKFLRRYCLAILFPGLSFFLFFFILDGDMNYYPLLVYSIWLMFFARFVVRGVRKEYAAMSCAAVEQTPVEQTPAEEPEEEEDITLISLWARIEKCMKDIEPWRNPDLRLEDFARMVHTNRTTLSKLIHSKSGCTFNEYLAKYRVDAFCDFARENYVSSISDLFMTVGFKSTSTAFKHFKRIHGVTPNEFLKKDKVYPPPPTQHN